MTYYVRRASEAEIEGPFVIEQINQMVRQKQLTFKALAVADSGQGLQAVQGTPAKQWMKVADLPGYEPDPEEERNCLSIALIIFVIIAVFAVIGLIKLADIIHRIH